MRTVRADWALAKGHELPKTPGISVIIRNVVMMAFSLGFIILSFVCYLGIKGVFSAGYDFSSYYNGMYLWELIFTNPEYFSESFATDSSWAFLELIPLIFFSISCIHLILSIVLASGKKYGRVLNLAFGAISFVLGMLIIFIPYQFMIIAHAKLGIMLDIDLAGYTRSISSDQYVTIYLGAVIGFVQLVCASVFLMPLKKKAK